MTYIYEVNYHILEQVNANPCIRMTLCADFKLLTQINKICYWSNSTLEFIRRNLKHWNEEIQWDCIHFVCSFVARLLVWNPYIQKDIYYIENIQRRTLIRVTTVMAMMKYIAWKPFVKRSREPWKTGTNYHKVQSIVTL